MVSVGGVKGAEFAYMQLVLPFKVLDTLVELRNLPFGVVGQLGLLKDKPQVIGTGKTKGQ